VCVRVVCLKIGDVCVRVVCLKIGDVCVRVVCLKIGHCGWPVECEINLLILFITCNIVYLPTRNLIG